MNGKLFPTLKAIAIDENTPMSQIIVRTAFEDNNNYMKDGILLRQVINVIDEIDFEEYEDRHAFGEIYETILRSLQSAGNSGEFYTPRAVTDFMVQMIKPKLGESIADFACGTGGFLTSALKVLDAQVQTVEDRTVYSNSIYGIEKKALPFLLCATNMLLHDIDNLHTVIRMPHSVFAPYTSITTNILFFDRTHPTTETWFYRLDMPEGYKNFSKTKPMKLEHFAPTVEWWDNREEITIDGFDKAKKYTVEELKARSYNIDLCGYPHEEEEILPPKELIQQYQEKRASLNADIDRILAQITDILGIDITEEGDE